MLKYRAAKLRRAGVLGAILVMLVIAVFLQPQRITQWALSIRHQALFNEAGGLVVGNDVTLSGIKVGSVSAISLQHGKALVTFTTQASYRLGSETSAHIRTGTLLGERVLTLRSAGSGALSSTDVIPTSRTSSPYSLTDAVSELTTNTAGTDTDSVNHSLDTLATTINRIAPQLGPTFDGLTRLSQSLNSRDDQLDSLLKSAADVSKVLAERGDQVNTVILNADNLLGVLTERRQAIVNLLSSTSAVARELRGLIADNEAKLAPTLRRLNSISEMLQRNADTIAKSLAGLVKYQLALGEAVSNGFYYSAYIPNLIPSQALQPFLDYAFGFRRGVNAGQPPDNAGPRSELPFPVNGIPGGSR